MLEEANFLLLLKLLSEWKISRGTGRFFTNDLGNLTGKIFNMSFLILHRGGDLDSVLLCLA